MHEFIYHLATGLTIILAVLFLTAPLYVFMYLEERGTFVKPIYGVPFLLVVWLPFAYAVLNSLAK
ncbi:hypothetical protein [Novilysobacter arseniciresistens]|uniref:hypothetical protein n=1 Tax=Novilysobacter arseniciresistens TaxID=1385522 RepID=UPI001269C00B|nr:hypothetical protein [Lysobacter arseniciresistens]